MKGTAVLWVRVSSEAQSTGYSLDSQERLVSKAAEGYEFRTFNVTESAKTSEARREFKAMIDFVVKNKVEHLFAWSHDRLARHYKDFATLQSLVDDHDVSIHLVESNKEISRRSPITDRFMFQVLAALAEADNRKRAADTKRGMDQKASEGGVPHLVPIGYLNAVDPEDKNPDPAERKRIVIKDPERFDHVKWAWETYDMGGWSFEKIVKELNRRGLTTKPSPKRPSGPVSVSHIQKVYENHFYHGEFSHDSKLCKGTYEPMVSKVLWKRVEARRLANKTHSRPETKKWFCYRPFTKCGYCRASITAYEQEGRHGRGHYVYYECQSSKKRGDPEFYLKRFGTENCPQRRWTEKEIEQFVDGEIGKLYVNDFIAAEVKERLKRAAVKEDVAEVKELQRLQSEFTRLNKHLRLSYKDRLDEKISIEHYEEIVAETQADLDRISGDLDRLGRHNVKFREQGSLVIELLKGVKEVYSKADQHGKQKFLEVLVKEIVLKKEPVVVWQEPFDTLFALGEVFREKGIWGE